MNEQPTHYEMAAGNCDIYVVRICAECGKEIQEKVNTVFRNYEPKAIRNGLNKLPRREADELCQGDCA